MPNLTNQNIKHPEHTFNRRYTFPPTARPWSFYILYDQLSHSLVRRESQNPHMQTHKITNATTSRIFKMLCLPFSLCVELIVCVCLMLASDRHRRQWSLSRTADLDNNKIYDKKEEKIKTQLFASVRWTDRWILVSLFRVPTDIYYTHFYLALLCAASFSLSFIRSRHAVMLCVTYLYLYLSAYR